MILINMGIVVGVLDLMQVHNFRFQLSNEVKMLLYFVVENIHHMNWIILQ